MPPLQVKKMIETGLPGTQAEVKSNDGSHFDAIVISDEFAGKSTVKQHQMVYATLADSIQSNEIHALSLKTYTTQEWANKKKLQET